MIELIPRMYGLMIGLGVFVGAWVVAKVAKREGLDEQLVWGGLVWVVFGGIVGARAYHVVDLWDYYSQNLGEIVAVWHGGLGVFGALVGGLVGLAAFAKKKKVGKKEWLKWLDVASFGLPVGQVIGRWGNFFNQELYGAPTDLPWGVFIRPENRLAGYTEFERFQPLFLYESLLSLGLFGVMLGGYERWKWKMGGGRYMGLYLVGYGMIRMMLETMRLAKWEVGGVPMAMIVAGMMIAGGGWFVLRGKVK